MSQSDFIAGYMEGMNAARKAASATAMPQVGEVWYMHDSDHAGYYDDMSGRYRIVDVSDFPYVGIECLDDIACEAQGIFDWERSMSDGDLERVSSMAASNRAAVASKVEDVLKQRPHGDLAVIKKPNGDTWYGGNRSVGEILGADNYLKNLDVITFDLSVGRIDIVAVGEGTTMGEIDKMVYGE